MEWRKARRSVRKKLVEKIDEILKIFRSAKRWTQGYYAKDQHGTWTHLESPEAKSWCLTGVLVKVCSLSLYLQLYDVIKETILQLHPENNSGIVYWNDKKSTTIQDVRAVLRLAKKNILATLD